MALKTYNRKRDFSKTSEPPGQIEAGASAGAARFVVQEHHARRLHYDFRLEVDGVLKSWAVPKGPPAAARERRLAIRTEDHPLDYIDFAGDIPAGNYGAGHVSIWDRGTFEALGELPAGAAIDAGKIEVLLHGDRLNGKYDLIRTDDEDGQWLFIRSSKPVAPAASDGRTAAAAKGDLPGKAAGMPRPDSVQCMLASVADQPFSDPDWLFEIKWDGYRALLFVDPSGASNLVSRNRQPFDAAFPELASLGGWLTRFPAVVDGEIVALKPDGKPDFQTLQNRYGFNRSGRTASRAKSSGATVVYMAFDILYLDGRDLTGLPLVERRDILDQTIRRGGPIRISEAIEKDGEKLFEKLRALGMEGVIAKRASSPYMQQRSRAWLKIKAKQTMDAVIGGYTESRAEGRPFASLLIGAYSGDRLQPIGHVGTGCDEQDMDAIARLMRERESASSPFAVRARVNGHAHWLRPDLVCEVEFSERTGDGQLRHPVFVRLRPDKSAADCKLDEQPAPEMTRAAASPAAAAPPAPPALPKAIERALEKGSTAQSAHGDVDGVNISLSNLNKIYWPQTGATKRDLARYYARVAPWLLPHMADRPLVLQRYPDGVGGKSFFQHDLGEKRPSFLRTFPVEEREETVNYTLCDNLAGLLYCANLGSIPLHLWNVRVSYPQSPDRIVFDLDPGNGFSTTISVALELRKLLDELGLASYPKTSGAAGLHITLTVRPIYSSDQIVGFARLVGQEMERRMPDAVTTERSIKKRGESKVYLDCLQNGTGKTVVAPYSIRAEPSPTVSTPLRWDEVSAELDPRRFTIESVFDRLAEDGDLFAPALEKSQELGGAIDRLGHMDRD